MKECKYCLEPLDEDGFCSNCSIGKLLKRLAKLKKK